MMIQFNMATGELISSSSSASIAEEKSTTAAIEYSMPQLALHTPNEVAQPNSMPHDLAAMDAASFITRQNLLVK